jgi:hypothetical protein
MKSHLKLSFLVVALCSLLSCKKDDPTPLQLLQDSQVTVLGQNWVFNFWNSDQGNPNQYAHAYSEEAIVSAPYALKISATEVRDANAFCYWGQTVSARNVPKGKKLLLKAKIKLENVEGPGVSLVIRQDGINPTNQISTMLAIQSTQGVTLINGTSDFREYSVETTRYPGQVDNLVVFLVLMSGTTGTAYFDDITLTAY